MIPGTRVQIVHEAGHLVSGRTGTFIRMDGGLFRVEVDGGNQLGLVQYPMLKTEIKVL